MLGSSIFLYESNGIKNAKFWAVFWKLWSIIQSKVRSDAQSASDVCSSLFFLKTISFGKEIIFFVFVGFFNFSIWIQRYKERKILGGILKVMINYSVKGQKRHESASEMFSSLIFTLFQIDFWNIFWMKSVCLYVYFIVSKFEQIMLSIFRDAHLNVDIGQIWISAEFCFWIHISFPKNRCLFKPQYLRHQF